MKFKVGDRIINNIYGKGYVREISNGLFDDSILVEFDRWKRGLHDGNRLSKKEYVSNRCYWCKKNELKLFKYTYQDLIKCPIGTKVTFENGRIFVRVKERLVGQEFTDIDGFRGINDLQGLKDNWLKGYYGQIIKIEEPTYKTVYEIKKEILDEVEKKYLSSIIKPFQDKVCAITKTSVGIKGENIRIITNPLCDSFTLPAFMASTMYTGMEIDKEYTLEELGL